MAIAEWSRVVNTTIHKYIREEEVNVLRNRKVLALMESKGRISFNHSGDLLDWKVRFRRSPMSGYADMDTLTFARRDRDKTAQLEWRGYAATDAVSKKEKEMNKSTEAIVKVFSGASERLMEDVEDQFGDEIYIDGTLATNSKRMHGMESFMGNSGTATVGFIANPSATYAGLITNLGNYGGSWSVDGSGNSQWPTGTGDAHYDFWSPLLVDYTNSHSPGWSSATATFAARAVEVLRYGIVKSRKNKSKRGMLDMIMLNDELYRQFEGAYATNERLIIKRGDKKDGLYALGFEDVINFDGCEVTYEYGVPINIGYGFSMMNMELCSLQSQLFVADGPDWDPASRAWRFSIDFLGNMRMNPRYFVKWYAYGGS